jgi:isopropylmalate/homocitrate/citramalate synthase
VTIKNAINVNRVYYNYQGRMPPVTLDNEPAPVTVADTKPRLITDTTLRDGAQDSRFAFFPNEQRLRYVDLLHQLDNGSGRIDAIETFLYQKRDTWVLEKLLDRGYDYPRITTWIRANSKDVKDLYTVSQGRVKETGMLASASDHHIFDKLGYQSKNQAAEKYLKSILTACEYGITPRVHLEDTTRADIHGWVIPFMVTVLERTEGRAKFRVCDTIGWGIPDSYASAPQGIPKLISTLYHETGAELEFHGHNDFGLATANSIAAWRYGCRRVNAAFAGLGERTGNTSLEQMLASYIRVYGDPGFNLGVLPEMKALVEDYLVPLPTNAPVIGEVFSTQAGIHQSGVARQSDAAGGLIYLAYDPAVVGKAGQQRMLVGSLSGADGIVAILNDQAEKRGISTRVTTMSRVVKRIYDHVQDAYNGEYDERTRTWEDYRTSFFTPEEIWDMAAADKIGPTTDGYDENGDGVRRIRDGTGG